ncbi:MAG: bifunctional indole-3-glycerol-phosphate synthase TrpC/phosphoribosylanthranilate isomerase TrpF [Deltaproteobacteria bacterium]|nr:bifunctional indole-3-glycerol-phosphate synthase TrpC/phosphoribosylanthranilate isomerase TrpF [Deltaproteobacteria bacterium]
MTVIERIVEGKRAEVAARKAARPLASFADALAPSDRSLDAALRAPRTGFVLECKRASPSKGTIRPDYDPVGIAKEYAPFADAVSVLADAPWFGGSLDHVAAVRACVPVPVLCKDFTVDPYQVFEARLHGADAVLLMRSVLEPAAIAACTAAADRLAMDCVVEVHDEAELSDAVALGARIVGVNNRDFRTLAVDLDVTRRLAPLVPPGVALVCESGVRDRADVRDLRPLADAFLVGTSLMTRPDLGRAVRELVFGRAKVCGLTRPDDAAAAFRSGATHGGLVLAPSPRRLTPDRAREVRDGAPGLAWVGVFVDEEAGAVAEAARSLDLAAVQLHGREDEAYVSALRPLLPAGCEVWKVVRVGDAPPDLAACGADRVLLDTADAALAGGTGRAFDWSLVPAAGRNRIVLAGGLSPANAATADALGCWALDVSSGVEAAPGIKDGARIAAFFGVLRGNGRAGTARQVPRRRGADGAQDEAIGPVR